MVFINLPKKNVTVTVNNRQQIVEIMSHTTGKLTDSLHFLRLPDLLFQRLSIRNISYHTDKTGMATAVIKPAENVCLSREDSSAAFLVINRGKISLINTSYA